MKQNPYIGLRPYKEEEKGNFFGRDREKMILLDKIVSNKLTLLFAASGVGKSSLLRAGIIPNLLEKDHDVVYVFEWIDENPETRLKHEIIKSLKNQQRVTDNYQANFELDLVQFVQTHQLLFCKKRLIIILDQFEEFFYYQKQKPHFNSFLKSISEIIQTADRKVIFVLSMREDFALELNAFKPYLIGLFDNFYRLEKLSKQAAALAILKPLEKIGFQFEEGLLETLVDDLSLREQIERYGLEQALELDEVSLFVEPPNLQIVCSQLWELEQFQTDKIIHRKIYEQQGKAAGFLEIYFDSRINELDQKEKQLASAAFNYLINVHGAKEARSLNYLAKLLKVNEKTLEQTLLKLEQARILRKTERRDSQQRLILWFELYHDVFAKKANAWNELFKAKQRRKKALKIAMAGIGILIGIDTGLNAHFQHLRTNPKTNAIELYQGYLNSFDIFGQQRFLAEMPFEREQLEADKRFEKHQLIDNTQLFLDLTGKLPIAKRVQAYFENGEFEKALILAKDNISKDSSEVSKQIIEHLVMSHSLESVKLLESIFYAQKTIPSIKINIVNTISNPRSHKTVFVPFLINLLKDNDSVMRSSAARILGRLQAKEAIPQLIKLLKDFGDNVRSSAAQTLGTLQATEATPQLIELLKHQVEVLLKRYNAKLLIDNNENVRSSAIDALGRLQAKEATPQLIELLKDNNNNVRYRVIDALGRLQAKEAIPQLIELLIDNNENVRSSAIDALGRLQAKEAIPQLIKLIKDFSENVRSSAARILGILRAKEAIPQLIKLLKDEEWRVRSSAINALGQLQAKEVIPQLIELLKDNNENVRSSAIDALGRLQAKEAIPQLIKLIKDSDRLGWERKSSINALAELQAKEVIPQLIELLKDFGDNARSSAAQALGTLQATEAIPQLIELLKDKESNVSSSAIKALGQLQAKEAIPQLLQLTNHYDEDTRKKVSSVLSQFKILKQPLLEKTKSQILPDFLCLKAQILNEESTNKTKVAALRMMGKLKTKEAAQFIIEHFEEFGVFAIQALGDTKQKVALAFLKDQLKQLEQDKQALHQLREKENLNEEQQQRFQQLQEQSYLETEVAYSIAKLDPTNEGINLLEHPFLEVRNGAILGIGHFANLNIFKALLNHFQKTTKPIFRLSLYRAMDVSLLTLETEHNDKDPLQTIHDSLPNSSPQHHALKQRLLWTINEIAYRQQHPKDDDTFEELPIETPKDDD
jgi:HEAT repeat protein